MLTFQKLFKFNLDEISQDFALKTYMPFLFAVHILTCLFWHFQKFNEIISDHRYQSCWSFNNHCEMVTQFLAPYSSLLLPLYLTISLWGLFSCSHLKRAYWLLVVVEFIKLFFQFLDYNFMGNYHFMAHIVTLFFLFFPQKKTWIKLWLITFYLAAASLKFNLEWLSGASMSWKVPFQNMELLSYLAFMALLVELTAPFFISFDNSLIKKWGLLLLVLFHITSYYWVGFFYPSVMLCLLSIFILNNEGLNSKSLALRPSQLVNISLWALFIFFQIKNFTAPRTHALDSDKRLFSLNMFDARSDCYGFFIVHDLKTKVQVNFKNESTSVRVKCDPQVFFNQAKKLCLAKPNPISVEAHLASRLHSDLDFANIIDDKNICQKI